MSSRVPTSLLVPLSALVFSALSTPLPLNASSEIPGEGGSRPRFDAVNPAAAYCHELGYGYEITQTPEGERAVCVLPNGERVDAWDFFRGKCGREYAYCARLGLATAVRREHVGSFTAECAVCVDRTGEEVGTVAELMGLQPTLRGRRAPPRHGRPVEAGAATHRCLERDTPPSFDWRALDGCTSIKDQGNCGSCWAFGSTAPLECNILIKDRVERNLSEQWLVSCNRDDWSCNGGGFAHNYYQWKTDPCGGTGAVLEWDFPYWGSDLPCGCPYPHEYLIDNWSFISRDHNDVPIDGIKAAIMEYGPVSVGVAVDGLFHGYSGGIFDACGYDDINHLVALVGWDDSQGPGGVWILRNSWGPGWGEDGYMRIAYGCNAVGYGASWVDYRDPIRVSLPERVPDVLMPGEPTTIVVRIEELSDSYVPGSGKLHYRHDGAGYLASDLAPLGGDLYRATLPAPGCGDRPEFYFTARGERWGVVRHPSAPGPGTYVCTVGIGTNVFADDFEVDTGWSVESGPGLTDGDWDRGVPVGGGNRGDPPTDADGSGRCYLTDNTDGNSDVDGGRTRLTSPALDLSDCEDARVRFSLWYTNNHGDNPQMDVFNLYVSDDDGLSWTLVDSVGPTTPMPMDWHERTFVVGDHVALTEEVRVRFEASDLWSGSLVEAGIDAFSVERIECDPLALPNEDRIAHALALDASAPNPFRPETVIGFELPAPERITLTIYDASGRVVRTLVDGERRRAGRHEAAWDGRDDGGRRVASGAYFYRLAAGGEERIGKMLLVK
jgi:putative hemolysin